MGAALRTARALAFEQSSVRARLLGLADSFIVRFAFGRDRRRRETASARVDQQFRQGACLVRATSAAAARCARRATRSPSGLRISAPLFTGLQAGFFGAAL